MEFRLQEDDLLIGAYFGEGNTNVIFCSGLPQYPSNYHPFVQDLVSLGCNVFVPRYAGTWESDGDFTPQTSVESITKTIELAKRGSAFETFSQSQKKWAPNLRTVLIGFSYGAMPALVNSNLADKTVLLMPFLAPIEDDESTNEMRRTLEFLGRGYKNVYRGMPDPKEFLFHGYVGLYSGIETPQKSVTIVQGNNDKAISQRQLDWAREHLGVEIMQVEAKHSANIGRNVYEEIVS